MSKVKLLLGFLIVIISLSFELYAQSAPKIFVFSKTAGHRHTSIEAGVRAIKKLGSQKRFDVFATEDAEILAKDLTNYDILLFLNTSEDILNDEQQEVVEKFIKNGGGFVGVHAAADTEYNWPWYGKMVGAYFKNHPEKQEATMKVCGEGHSANRFLKNKSWRIFDEWYNFKDINPNINPLLCLDETSYKGGENGAFHPIAWCHIYEGSRIFYTGIGHTEACYENPQYLEHLLGGINYVLKGIKISASGKGK